MESPFFLDIHGVRVQVSCDDSEAGEELRRDFEYFLAEPGPARVTVRARRAPPEAAPQGRAWLRWRSCRFLDRGQRRWLDYEGRAAAVYDFALESGEVRAQDPHLLHELSYLMIHSRVGAALDQRGLHRVHALGFCHQGRGGLLALPEGGGKSTLALELLHLDSRFRLLSDDIPLLDSGAAALRAFPLRLGLRRPDPRVSSEHLRLFRRRRHGDKHLVDLDLFRGRVASGAPLTWMIVGELPCAAGPSIADCSAWEAGLALSAALVAGVGTPQVLELLWPSPPYLPGMARMASWALSRGMAAARTLRRARLLRFTLGVDARANASALAEYLARA